MRRLGISQNPCCNPVSMSIFIYSNMKTFFYTLINFKVSINFSQHRKESAQSVQCNQNFNSSTNHCLLKLLEKLCSRPILLYFPKLWILFWRNFLVPILQAHRWYCKFHLCLSGFTRL